MNKISISLALALAFLTVNAQDPIVMEINGKPVFKSEFEAVYKKNSGKDVQNNNKSVKEYVDLFSLFKSKVFEAESLGLDTLTSFKNELSGYRRQLAAPYLTDKNTNDNLLHEAYDRLKTEVRASHILIRLTETALPKDTMEAYTRALLVRKTILGTMPTATEISNYEKILKNSTDVFYALKRKDSAVYKQKFNSVKHLADNYNAAGKDKFQDLALKTSDDPSVVDNKGDLNYFSALDMVYPFENAAFNTKVGDVSDIIKTKFGYHILKVYDKRAARGEITAEHIMAKFTKESTPDEKNNARKKIDELYSKLKSGANFEDLARQFSDDTQTKDKGGLLQPFKSGRLPKEFEDAAFAINKDGEYSQIVESPYGYHIIKRISLKTVPPFDEIKAELKTRVSRDSRSQMGRTALIAKVKKENGFKENLKNRDELAKVIDSTYLKSTWKADNAKKLGNKEIFNLANKSYTQMDYAKYLESQMTFRSPTDVVELMKSMYPNWVNEEVVKYEDSQLDKKYIEYKNLLREYRDGILLFDLTDQKVWSKAVRDSLGLNEYYNKNKNNYLWDERADVTTYKCLNEKIANEVRKQLKANKPEKEILEFINKSSQLNLSIENVTYLKGENKYVDANWKQGIAEKNSINDSDKKIMVIVVNKISPKTPKTLGECRGLVTADYQNYLETEWISYLKNKYKVKVNEDVLNTIK